MEWRKRMARSWNWSIWSQKTNLATLRWNQGISKVFQTLAQKVTQVVFSAMKRLKMATPAQTVRACKRSAQKGSMTTDCLASLVVATHHIIIPAVIGKVIGVVGSSAINMCKVNASQGIRTLWESATTKVAHQDSGDLDSMAYKLARNQATIGRCSEAKRVALERDSVKFSVSVLHAMSSVMMVSNETVFQTALADVLQVRYHAEVKTKILSVLIKTSILARNTRTKLQNTDLSGAKLLQPKTTPGWSFICLQATIPKSIRFVIAGMMKRMLKRQTGLLNSKHLMMMRNLTRTLDMRRNLMMKIMMRVNEIPRETTPEYSVLSN
jgi:hypothetical protein